LLPKVLRQHWKYYGQILGFIGVFHGGDVFDDEGVVLGCSSGVMTADERVL
jgi:hypothetical protein